MKGIDLISKIKPDGDYLPTNSAFRELILNRSEVFKTKLEKANLKRWRFRLNHRETISAKTMVLVLSKHGKKAGIVRLIDGIYLIESK